MKNSTFAVSGVVEAGTFGAIVINGGIGLVAPYEEYDGFEDCVESAIEEAVTYSAEVLATIRQNAHITLKELKEKVINVGTAKLPTFKALLNSEPTPVAERIVDDGRLTVFDNGFAVYEQGKLHTVIAVARCGGYRYEFAEGSSYVPAEVFDDAEWSVRLLMEGERHLEQNRRYAHSQYETYAEDGNIDFAGAVMVDFLQEDNAELIADQELQRLYAAIGKLTERQQEVIQLYYFKGMTQEAIGEELGISQVAVKKMLDRALKSLKKLF